LLLARQALQDSPRTSTQPLLGLDGVGVGAAVPGDIGAGVITVDAGVGEGEGVDIGSGSGSGSGSAVGVGVAADGVGADVAEGPVLPAPSLKSAQFRNASGYESCELPVMNNDCNVHGFSCVQDKPAGK